MASVASPKHLYAAGSSLEIAPQNLPFRGCGACTRRQFLISSESGEQLFFPVSRSSAQEKAGTQGFTDCQGFALTLSCPRFYRSYFLYGNLIKKETPSEHKAAIEQQRAVCLWAAMLSGIQNKEGRWEESLPCLSDSILLMHCA